MNRPTPANRFPTPTTDEAVEEYGVWIKRKALHIHDLMPWADVEELIQWGVVALLEARERFDPTRGSPFAPFAKQRIRGAMLDSLRREGNHARRVSRSPSVVADNTLGQSALSDNPLNALLQQAEQPAMAEAIAQLTQRQQMVLHLFFVEELNNREIAEVLKVSQPYVSKTRHRALDRLLEILEPTHSVPSEGEQ